MSATADANPSPRILNVDDDEASRNWRSVVLRAAGFTVHEASSGFEALDAVVGHEFDVLLLDVGLPDLNGFDVCARVKGDPRTCDLPVIHISATCVTDNDWSHGLSVGADNYLIEPVDAEVLVGTIRLLVHRRQREEGRRREQAQVVEALQSSEQRYRELVMHAPYGICTLSRDGRVMRANRALMEILEYDALDDVCAVNVSEFFQKPADCQAFIDDWQRLGRVRGHEAAWRTRDGRPLTVRLMGRVLADDPMPDELFEVFVDDVTDARRVETEMRQAQKIEGIGRLASGIAHDFNNLLTAILGYTELMLQQIDVAKPIYADLREVQKAGQSAAALTQQLLAFSRKQKLQIAVLDMNDVVSTTERLLDRVLGDNVTIVVRRAPDAPRLKADAVQLEQVLVNLAVNGRDAMPDGGTLTIETALVQLPGPRSSASSALLAPGSYVRVSVTDT
ncbi:MAG: response regulator, partial [Luteitalea sp.]|nr:response regulator [Luteitalea sp.]